MTGGLPQGTLLIALAVLALAAVAFTLRSFQLLYRDIRPKYRPRHRRRRLDSRAA